AGDLSRPIGSEIEEDERVAILDLADRLSVGADDRRWLDELIALVCRVASLNRFLRAHCALTGTLNIRRVRAIGALPAMVAIHAVVTPADRPDPSNPEPLDLLLQFLEIPLATPRRRVAAIQNGVNHHLFGRQMLLAGHFQKRKQ